MLKEQHSKIIAGINMMISESSNSRDTDVYNRSIVKINMFYDTHKETKPTVDERDKCVGEIRILEDEDSRNTMAAYHIILLIIKVYEIDDQLEKEYVHKINHLNRVLLGIEEPDDTGPNFGF